MFLKAYLNTSDRQLFDRYNTDWPLKYFCGKVLAENQQNRDMTIMTKAYLEKHCEWEKLQEVLSTTGCMISTTPTYCSCLSAADRDATLLSFICFPNNVNLLWKSYEWVFEKQLFRLCSQFGIKRPRSKFRKQRNAQMAYSRKSKNSFRGTLRRRKALVNLLDKGIDQLQ